MFTGIKCTRFFSAQATQLRLLVALIFFVNGSAWALSPTVEQIRKSIILDVEARDNQVIAVGERGYIVVSQDHGKNWFVGKTPVAQTLTAVFVLDEKHAWAVGHDGIILASTDSGRHWRMQYSHQLYAETNPDEEPGYGPLMDIWFYNEKEGFAIGSFGQFLHTRDGGKHWQDVSGSLDNLDEYHLNAIISAGPQRLLIAGEAGLAFISNDLGSSWEQRQMPKDGSLFGALHSTSSDALYLFGLQGYLYRSSDHGNSWQAISTGVNSTLYKAFLENETTLYFFGGDGLILSTRDQGEQFDTFRFADRRAITAGTLIDDHLLLTGLAGLQRVEGKEIIRDNTASQVAERVQ